jgi:hypothetical protein
VVREEEREEIDDMMQQPPSHFEALTAEQEEKILAMFDELRKAVSMLSNRLSVELKTLKKPPRDVEIAVAALMIVFGETDLSWENSNRILMQKTFM